MPLSKSGFTLIELLVIVSIIALLAVLSTTYTQSAKIKAKNVSFQSTANSVKNAIGICCSGGTGTINTVLGQDMCTPASGSIYPTGANLGSVEVIRGCSDVQGYSVKLTPGTSNAATMNHALCDRDSCDFIPN